jgi:formylglycine-generating enzyme required for sulfatase activity
MKRILLIAIAAFLLLCWISAVCLKARKTIPEAASPQQAQNQASNLDSRTVAIPLGTIEMGINQSEIPHFEKIFNIFRPQLFQDEIPKHTVTVDSFHIDKYLVTNAQFKEFVMYKREWQPGHVSAELDNGNYLKHWNAGNMPVSLADHPVVNVNWFAAVAYCQWEGKRLPTEAEWEYAARAGLSGPFPWGDQPVDGTRANYSGSGLGSTSIVGKYPANGYGVFDMAGNVWQFLADEWQHYSSGPQRNPVAGGNRFAEGTSFLQVRTRRVIRGGSFEGAPVNLWVEYRDSHPPNGSREFVGFRCAR